MTTEELLRPRIKVIALWLNHHKNVKIGDVKIGDVINVDDEFNQDIFWVGGDPVSIKEIKQYPHLFELLPWWAERKAEDIGYVCVNTETHYVIGKAVWILKDGYGQDVIRLDNCKFDFVLNDYVKPSTEQEYTLYINSIIK